MSIKPRFGEEVLSGSKRYELRRLVGPLVEPGDVVYLYFTRPVSAVVGRFTAGLVFVVPTENLGRVLAELGDVGVGEEDLKYVEGARYAMLIQVRDPSRCRTAVRLSEIGEPPPPSYRKVAKKKAERLATLCGL